MLRRTLPLLAALLLTPAVAGAQTQGKTTARYYGKLLSQVALNATAATRTITVNTSSWPADATDAKAAPAYSKLVVMVDYTYSAATTVTATFTCSLDGTTYGSKTTRKCTDGACTLNAQVDTWTTGAANATFNPEYEVRSCKSIKILFGGASAGAGDLVDVYATATAGG